MPTIQEKLNTWYKKVYPPLKSGGLDNPGHIIKFQSKIPNEIIHSNYRYRRGAFILQYQTNDFCSFKYVPRTTQQNPKEPKKI